MPGPQRLRRYCIAFCLLTGLLLSLVLPAARAFAHGSIVDEGDICVLTLGFYSAHFTIYQTGTSGQKQFCEDIPDVTDTIFVMEYLHRSLREVPVEFRIIRDDQERGRFVRWEDLLAMGDLDPVTVFYQPPTIHPFGVLTVQHEFAEAGDYIGIVSAPHPEDGFEYHAVFPFHVGPPKLGYWPWIVVLLIAVQLNWWWMGGGLVRWRRIRAQ